MNARGRVLAAAGRVRRRTRRWIHESQRGSLAFYRAYSWANPRLRPKRVTRRTELVLDGFPRSANTYARVAFDFANGSERRVASHLHSPHAIALGARYGVPTVLLIRPLGDLMASLHHFHAALRGGAVAELEPALVARSYIEFHEQVRTHLDRVLVVDFATVTKDFGAVVPRINEVFGTDFTPYERTEENEAEVRRLLDAGARWFAGERAEEIVARPSSTREPDQWGQQDPEIQALLSRADDVYATILSGAPHRAVAE